MTEAFSPRRVRPGWLTGPKPEPEAIEFHREVPWWELNMPVTETVNDESYRRGPVLDWMSKAIAVKDGANA